jgi:lysyl-tRNA synthetase class 2
MTVINDWRPTAEINTLKLRAQIFSAIRSFFAERNIVEVETPLMCRAPVTDPFLEALSLEYNNDTWYLQTSPEYAMKRLLCAGSGSIYQLCKAFRKDESGRLHNAEFTMLEWYHLDFNHHNLMNEMDDFLQAVIQTKPAKRFSYQNLFEIYLNINPHIILESELKRVVTEYCGEIKYSLDKDDYLNLLMTHVIEPKLDKDYPIFIYDYPPSQAALSKIRQDKFPVGERFEVYLNGVELANGYHELRNAKEQKIRFNQDLEKRKKLNLPMVPIDNYLLSALEQGLPNCAGVALGIDRLIMIALKKQTLSEVISFDQKCI